MEIKINIDDEQLESQIEKVVESKMKPLIKTIIDKQVSRNKILDESYYEIYHSRMGEIIRNIVIDEFNKQRVNIEGKDNKFMNLFKK